LSASVETGERIVNNDEFSFPECGGDDIPISSEEEEGNMEDEETNREVKADNEEAEEAPSSVAPRGVLRRTRPPRQWKGYKSIFIPHDVNAEKLNVEKQLRWELVRDKELASKRHHFAHHWNKEAG
jgi:hypothetical protein